MKLIPTLTAVCTCLTAYTTAALAAEVASEAATESADPSLSGILPAEQGAGDGSEATSDEEVSGKGSSKSHGREAKNAIYVDLLGPGLIWSLNYDREIVDDLAVRIGFSYFSIGVSASDGAGNTESASASYWSLPITASYLGIGSKSNMLELGGGGVIIGAKGSGVVDAGEEEGGGEFSGTLVGMTALAGYRHQPHDGGFVFRVGASPVKIMGANFLPWGYLSLGAAF